MMMAAISRSFFGGGDDLDAVCACFEEIILVHQS